MASRRRLYCALHPLTHPRFGKGAARYPFCPACRKAKERSARGTYREPGALELESWEQFLVRRPELKTEETRPSDLDCTYFADVFPRGRLVAYLK